MIFNCCFTWANCHFYIFYLLNLLLSSYQWKRNKSYVWWFLINFLLYYLSLHSLVTLLFYINSCLCSIFWSVQIFDCFSFALFNINLLICKSYTFIHTKLMTRTLKSHCLQLIFLYFNNWADNQICIKKRLFGAIWKGK